MGNSYKNCKIQDNTAELIYENGSLFVTIFENNIVHVVSPDFSYKNTSAY